MSAVIAGFIGVILGGVGMAYLTHATHVDIVAQAVKVIDGLRADLAAAKAEIAALKAKL